jgi:hypothetical protein
MTPGSFKAAIAAVCLVCLTAVSAAVAQEKQAPLPDVNVTAPATPNGSFITRGFTSPFVGHTRVEEDKWPVIPCTHRGYPLPSAARARLACRPRPG